MSQVENLLLVVLHSSQLANQRRGFEKAMGPVVELEKDQVSCHQAISESLQDLKVIQG